MVVELETVIIKKVKILILILKVFIIMKLGKIALVYMGDLMRPCISSIHHSILFFLSQGLV